jgi:hypothetical protein
MQIQAFGCPIAGIKRRPQYLITMIIAGVRIDYRHKIPIELCPANEVLAGLYYSSFTIGGVS